MSATQQEQMFLLNKNLFVSQDQDQLQSLISSITRLINDAREKQIQLKTEYSRQEQVREKLQKQRRTRRGCLNRKMRLDETAFVMFSIKCQMVNNMKLIETLMESREKIEDFVDKE